MKIFLHKIFLKKFSKLDDKVKQKFKERKNLFLTDTIHPLLNNHPVDKVYPGCRSINITGDYRAIFRHIGDDVEFINIGTHSQLYG